MFYEFRYNSGATRIGMALGCPARALSALMITPRTTVGVSIYSEVLTFDVYLSAIGSFSQLIGVTISDWSVLKCNSMSG